MAASTTSLTGTNATDAEFRAWVAAVIAAITAGGMVRTADTGQINEATVLKPAAANTYQGYAVFRSNDGGSLNEWYVRIDFGSGTGAQTQPSMKFTFGWSTDGAGTINSANKTSALTISSVSSDATSRNTNFSAGTGWFILNLWDNSASSAAMLASVERTRNKNGVEQDEIFFWIFNSSSSGTCGVLPRTGTVPTFSTSVTDGACSIVAAMAPYDGLNYGVGTIRPIKGGFCMDSANLFLGNGTHFTATLMNYAMNVYGASHNYLSRHSGAAPAPVASTRILIRYE